jgi:hypothetical protein
MYVEGVKKMIRRKEEAPEATKYSPEKMRFHV